MSHVITHPLTHRQEALWIDEEIHPNIPVNNVLTRLTIRGQLNTDLFRNSFNRLCAEHFIFNSVIDSDSTSGKRVFKQIERTNAIEVIEVDNDLSDFERSDKFQQWCTHKFIMGECLYKAQLIKFSNELYVFYLNQHHVITDGFSCDQIHQALSGYYQTEAASDDKTYFLPTHDNYTDFLAENSVQRQSVLFEEKETFWRAHFDKPVEPIQFYNQPPYNKTAKTTRLSYKLDTKTVLQLNELSNSISTSIIFTSVFLAYLNRVTLNNDLSIGIPLLNRKSPYTHSIGLLMEVCPNRINVDNDDTFQAIVEKVRMEIDTVREFRDHFVSAKLSGYETILNIHSAMPDDFAGFPAEYELTTPLNILKNIESDLPSTEWSGRESLAIQVNKLKDGHEYELSFDFNMGVWTSSVLRKRAIIHFEMLLIQFLNNRSQKIAEVDLLTAEEKNLLFPKEDSAYVRGDVVPTVTTIFKQRVSDKPNKIAVQFKDQEISYLSLSEQVDELSQQLCELGVKPGDLVGVCIDRTPKMVICLLAVMQAGGAYVPIDPKQPSDRIAIILEDADPIVLITETELKQKVDGRNRKVIIVDEPVIRTTKNIYKYPIVKNTDLAYVIFTSGSTGRPKGVEVRHHGLTTFLQAMTKQPGMESHDTILSVTTISFDIAALELFLPLIIGATVRIAPYESTINGDDLIELLDCNITVFQATPATYRLLISSGWKGNSTLKIMCGGEALPYELAQKILPRCQSLWNMYGPTETTIWSSVHQVLKEEKNISIGKPIDGTQMFVLNAKMLPVPIGVAGELYIAGDGVANGYYKNSELTGKQFVPNIFTGLNDSTMYKTGDMVRYNLDMDLDYIGRIDFQVKIRGFRIEIGEIETVLEKNSSVGQSVVIAKADEKGEQHLIAYLVEEKGISIDGKGLQRYLKSKLPDYMIPSKYVLLDALPLTPNGKVDRKSLPIPERSLLISVGGEFQLARNDFERSLIAVWQEVLKLPKIGITDNFFDLGGDSLMTVQLIHEMERATGIKFNIGDIFNSPTIEQLSEIQNSDMGKVASSIVPLQSNGTKTPLFCLCGINIYQDFADSLGELQPVYGIYVADEQMFLEGVMRGESTDISIEKLVTSYYEAICRQQPEGPYQLSGVSFGGFLAIEVAKMLQNNNKEVISVTLLDTILPTEIQRTFLSKMKVIIKKSISKFTQIVKFKSDNMTSQDVANIREEAYLKCMETYVFSGKRYKGHVILMKATNHDAWGKGISFLPDYGWGRYVSERVECYEIEGDHLGIIKKQNVSQIAHYLLPHLR